jgi:hypothetical protein
VLFGKGLGQTSDGDPQQQPDVVATPDLRYDISRIPTRPYAGVTLAPSEHLPPQPVESRDGEQSDRTRQATP